MTAYKAYVSSTYSDLRPFREAAFHQLRKMGLLLVGMEYFSVTATLPLEKCLEAVRQSDIYILIIGHRYGFIPEGHDQSITHLEYEEAARLGIPIFSFVLSNDVAVLPSSIEADPARRLQLDSFKNEILRSRMVSQINSPESLAASLGATLFSFLLARAENKPQSALDEQLKVCQEEGERHKKLIDDLKTKLRNLVPADPIWRGRNFRTDELLCFGLLPFQEEFFEVYEAAVAPAAEDVGLRSLHAGEMFGNREVVEDIWDSICAARVIVVDVTGRNPNVFYELGICHTLGKECIVITQDKSDVPFDIRHRRFIEYKLDRLTVLRTTLRKTIQKVLGLNRDKGNGDETKPDT